MKYWLLLEFSSEIFFKRIDNRCKNQKSENSFDYINQQYMIRIRNVAIKKLGQDVRGQADEGKINTGSEADKPGDYSYWKK